MSIFKPLVPVFHLDPETLDRLEAEASENGVPLEWFVIEAFRLALWRCLAERQEHRREQDGLEVAARHKAIERNAEAFGERLRLAAERRAEGHKRSIERWKAGKVW